ncbi:MAG: nucleotidyltransferase family protein [Rhizomicrobium sp.]
MYRVVGHGSGCWPTARQRLLIEGCVGRRDSDAAWLEYAAEVGEGGVNEGDVRLFPLLASRISAKAGQDPRFGPLRRERLRAVAASAKLERAARNVSDFFAQAGIDFVVLKGFALTATVYRESGLRPFADIDLMVRPEAVPKIVDLLQKAGWLPKRKYPDLTAERLLYLRAFAFTSPDGLDVDIHWRQRGAFQWDMRVDRDFWANLRSAEWKDRSWRVPGFDWMLLDTIEHGTEWNEVHSIRWVVDSVLLLDRAEIDWEKVLSYVIANRRASSFHKALALIHDCGGKVPATVLEKLADAKPSALERLEMRLRMRPEGFFGPYLKSMLVNYFLHAPGGFRARLFGVWGYALRHILGYGSGESLGSIVTRKYRTRRKEFLARTNANAANRERSI